MAIATITSKGQVTIPRAIREALHLEQGDRLEFEVQPDGSATLRPVRLDARRMIGLLKDAVPPDVGPVSVADMDAGIAEEVTRRHREALSEGDS